MSQDRTAQLAVQSSGYTRRKYMQQKNLIMMFNKIATAQTPQIEEDITTGSLILKLNLGLQVVKLDNYQCLLYFLYFQFNSYVHC